MLAALAALVALAGCTGDEPVEGPADAGETTVDDAAAADLRFDGPDDGTVLNADTVTDTSFTVTGDDVALAARDVRLVLDDAEVATDHDGDTLTFRPDGLDDGAYTL